MAIAYKSQGAGASTETSGAALSPLCPATVDANDILIAHVFWEGTATAPSTPSGWTLLDGPRVIQTSIGRHWVFGKIAAGTEDGAAVAFGSPAVTTQRGARVYSFSGWVAGTIADLVNGFAATSHATDPQMPSVTTTIAGALAVALVAQNDNNAFGSPTGESGGDWVEAVAEYTVALTPGMSLGIETCTPTSNPGTVSGGAMATTNDPCGVIGFQIRPTNVTTSSISDTAGLTETVVKGVSKPLAETLGLSEVFSAVRTFFSTIGDTVGLAETFLKTVDKALVETVALTESRLLQVGKTFTDTVGLTETFTKTVDKRFEETADLAEAIAKEASRRLDEQMGLTEELVTDVTPGGPSYPPGIGCWNAYQVHTGVWSPDIRLPRVHPLIEV